MGPGSLVTYQLANAKIWDGAAWNNATGYNPDLINWLVVAGGGGGWGSNAGQAGSGAGAGGLRTSGREAGLSKALGDSFTVTVGAGGAGGVSSSAKGNDSVCDSITSEGGGAVGGDGGSSGGTYQTTSYTHGQLPVGVANTAGARQGNQGVAGMGGNLEPGGAGGGAGGNAAGGDWNTNVGSLGGQGLSDGIISGTLATAQSVGEVVDGFAFYGGGGGGPAGTTGGPGGIGGGGDATTAAGAAGTANTGGGGAGSRNSGNSGGNGGSGVVILSLSEIRSLTIGAGLTYSNVQENGRNIYIFTSGTGTVTVA
jgi:hypothetical protein